MGNYVENKKNNSPDKKLITKQADWKVRESGKQQQTQCGEKIKWKTRKKVIR